MMIYMDQPLSAVDARKLARQILATGDVTFTSHALAELAKDGKTTVDAINVIRGGVYREAEWENGGWRHQVQTQRFTVVIEFDSATDLIVITAWVMK
jgi:hypothetical protein